MPRDALYIEAIVAIGLIAMMIAIWAPVLAEGRF